MTPINTATRSSDLIVFQLARFLIVGGLATAIQYAILFALTGVGVQPLLASSIGFVASAIANYTLNRRFTFRSDVGYMIGLERFAIIAAVGLGLNAAAMAAGIALGMHYVAAQIVATAIVLIWNFQVNRIWTFAPGQSVSPSSRREIPPSTGS